jgi:ribosomal protein L12E/L44/L45/RPP1/RPP2
MEENKLKPLPLGKQTFKEIIEEDNLYVDKTEEIYKLFESKGKYFFLSRPRRFGKSLLISTLEEIFKGNKELFKTLFIYDKIDFKKYPVIKLTMNDLRYSGTIEDFENSLLNYLKNIYQKYNLKLDTNDYVLAFKNLIIELSKIEKVVLLIDEYDKPIIEYLGNNIQRSNEMRDILKNFYETIKANDEYIHFAFLTGVSKFSKTSIFSSLNNINDITMDERYSKIVGIDETQLYSYFQQEIIILANKYKKTESEIKEAIKLWYNGYSWDGKNFLYNPYSLILLFSKNDMDNYWFETGSPSFLIKMIKEYDIDIKKLENIVLSKEDFSSYDIDEINVYAILFQTGYLTIKEIIYDEYEKDYVLSYPNKEVKDSLLKYILNDYIGKILTSEISIKALIKALQRKNIDDFINILKSIFASIPNQIHPEKNNTVSNKEYYYHTIFHLIFTLIGVKISSEVSVSKGFIDSLVETNDTIYIFEFKLEKNPKIALDQIENRKYYEKYLSSNKEIILVGVSFDMEERSIKDYLIRKLA